jgi:hypothetical protein
VAAGTSDSHWDSAGPARSVAGRDACDLDTHRDHRSRILLNVIDVASVMAGSAVPQAILLMMLCVRNDPSKFLHIARFRRNSHEFLRCSHAWNRCK